MPKALYRSSDARRQVAIRQHPSWTEPYRSPWRRDYARLIHSPSFRRLQGKTQLFPGNESDFFRNRLTHSLEVAQIAKSIAIKINSTHPYFTQQPIDTDLIETAALAHDLGHPPFGHNGELALNACMARYGGFEGNAQTLRILAKLEKRDTATWSSERPQPTIRGRENRVGLNLTYRTLASVLKYDRLIPRIQQRPKKPIKGYYYTEAPLVERIRSAVCPTARGRFHTIECSIMDLADDIAYSTYDLEDSFKAGFLSPLKMLAEDEAVVRRVAESVRERLQKPLPVQRVRGTFSVQDAYWVLFEVFNSAFDTDRSDQKLINDSAKQGLPPEILKASLASEAFGVSEKNGDIGVFQIAPYF